MKKHLEGKTVLILGANSSIARDLAWQMARAGATLHLAGRDGDEVHRIAQDVAIRYQVPTAWSLFDAEAFDTHGGFLQQVLAFHGRLDGVVIIFGYLGDQAEAQQNFQHTRQIIDINYTGVVSILTHIANHLEQQGHGFIIGCSSVAGDRGRQSNYVYGSAKGGLSLFLQGLRNRLAKANVHVLTVKPGFVDTKMTFGKPGMFLVARPEQVAKSIMNGLIRKKNELYVPWFWFWIMTIIRTIPEPVFKRMKL